MLETFSLTFNMKTKCCVVVEMFKIIEASRSSLPHKRSPFVCVTMQIQNQVQVFCHYF